MSTRMYSQCRGQKALYVYGPTAHCHVHSVTFSNCLKEAKRRFVITIVEINIYMFEESLDDDVDLIGSGIIDCQGGCAGLRGGGD